MLCAVDRSLGLPGDAVIAGDPSLSASDSLRRAAIRPYAPDLVLASVADSDPTATWPIFVDKTPRDGRPTAYVCRGYACEAPTEDPAQVTAQVERLAVAAR
jgi:uncharacterized protein YyaL (SSP411 family)